MTASIFAASGWPGERVCSQYLHQQDGCINGAAFATARFGSLEVRARQQGAGALELLGEEPPAAGGIVLEEQHLGLDQL